MGRRIFFGLAASVILLALACALIVALADPPEAPAEGRVTRLGTLDDVLARYPPRQANPSALALESLAAALGIDLAPRSFEDRVRPTDEVARAWRDVGSELQWWLNSELKRADGRIEPPPVEVLDYLDTRTDAISAVVRHLRQADPPRWQIEIERLHLARIPNLLGHLALARLLVAEALHREQAGDGNDAEATLDAAWRLTRTLEDDPITICRLIGFTETRLLVGAMRHVRDLAPHWRDRLDALRPRGALLESLELDGWVMTQTVERPFAGTSVPNWATIRLAAPYVRLCATDAAERFAREIERLASLDHLCDRDLSRANADLVLEFPRWNVLGGMLIPNLRDSTRRVARLEIDIELTRRILEVEAVRAIPGSTPGLDLERSAACPDDRWTYEATVDGGYRLAFGRAMAPPGLPGFELPLAHVAAGESSSRAPTFPRGGT